MKWQVYLNDKVECEVCKYKALRDEIERNNGKCDDCSYQVNEQKQIVPFRV